ncbi:recombinase family protein [Streptomyces anatolicus]|nr:recombinase family protein [Streptomyces anatolicus]
MPIAPEYLHMVFPDTVFHALLYGRASRDPKKKGRSVADQINTGREMCDTFNWPIAEVFDQDIDRSASRHARRARKDFEALIDSIEAGRGRIVVAFEASRYYRDIEAYIRLRNACMANNVLLCYNGQVYDLSKREDRKATAQDAIAAEDEAEGIRDRVLRTTRAQAKKGAPHGRILWGYGRRYDPDTGDLVEQYVLPERGSVVVDIFQRVEAGESMYSILHDLQSQGDRLPGGMNEDGEQEPGIPWRYDHLSSMLRNWGYIGKRVFQGEIIGDAAWPPISNGNDDEGFIQTFHNVQKIVNDPKRRTTHDSSVKHELSFLGLCGECEEEPYLKVLKGRGYLNYTCRLRYDTVMRKETLEAYVEEAVVQWLSSPAAAEAFRNDAEQKAAAASRALAQALTEQLEEARAKAGQMTAQGRPVLSIASLAAIEAQLIPQIEAAEEAGEVTSAPPLVRRLLSAEDVDALWQRLTVPQRRTVYRAVVTVRLYKARARGVRRIEPGRITLSFVGQPGFRPHTSSRASAPATRRSAGRIV